MKRLLAFALAALALAFAPAAVARAEDWMGAVEAPDRDGDAAYAAPSVSIPGHIGGDVMILAGIARIEGEVGDDARVMARRYTQTGSIGGELAVAAHNVDVDGAVGDDLYVAGQDVRLGSEARIGQDGRIFGDTVLVKGRIDRNLDISGEEVALSAQVGGDVTIHAKRIILGPNTTIEGKLIWRSPNQPEIPVEAIIRGGASGTLLKSWHKEGMWSWASPFHGAPRAALFAGEAAGRLMVALSAFAVGLILVLATPHYADRVFATFRERWAASLGWGAGVLILLPILAVLMMLTIVGIPLGFLVLLSLPLVALWGYAAGAGALGALAFRQPRIRYRVFSIAAGIAALTVLALAPLVGWLFGFVATLIGLGAMAIALRPRPVSS